MWPPKSNQKNMHHASNFEWCDFWRWTFACFCSTVALAVSGCTAVAGWSRATGSTELLGAGLGTPTAQLSWGAERGSTPWAGRELFHVIWRALISAFDMLRMFTPKRCRCSLRFNRGGVITDPFGSSRWAIEIRNFSEVEIPELRYVVIADSAGRVFSHCCIKIPRRCIEAVGMSNSCCTDDRGSSVFKINISVFFSLLLWLSAAAACGLTCTVFSMTHIRCSGFCLFLDHRPFWSFCGWSGTRTSPV